MKERGRNILLTVFIVVISMFFEACKIEYEIDKPASIRVDRSAELVEEGKRLSLLMCATCHLDESTNSFTGKRLYDVPAIVGEIYAPNITQHPSSRIASYKDEDLKYLFKTGLSKDGKLMTYMLRPNLADEDIDAIISFLRSDDPLVAPNANGPRKTRYTPVGKFALSRVKPLQYRSEIIRRPEEGSVKLGEYLIDNLGCYHCHSKSFLALDFRAPEKSKGFMGGGNKVRGAEGKMIKTSNLTFHPTGLGSWSEDDLKTLLRQGMKPDKSVVRYPMSRFAELTDGEIKSIYRYVKQLPAIENENDH
jgi:mono/diheme cytochrome c family protein